MKIFLFEFVTGGGFWRLADEPIPGGSLLLEGEAMVGGLRNDLSVVDEVDLTVLRDRRLPRCESGGARVVEISSRSDLEQKLIELGANADWTIIIAPEIDRQLEWCAGWLVEHGARLLAPSLETIRIGSDKLETASFLNSHGIPIPRTVVPEGAESFLVEDRPFVVKPRYGAGSMDITWIESGASGLPEVDSSQWLIQEYCRGTPVSVLTICGENSFIPLAACLQRLSADGRFEYLGGSLPLTVELDRRARSLAATVVRKLPRGIGFVGIDMVLSSDNDRSDSPAGSADRVKGVDWVIEINPRLTTSYVGLRAQYASNLADTLLRNAAGQNVGAVQKLQECRFSPDGRVENQDLGPTAVIDLHNEPLAWD